MIVFHMSILQEILRSSPVGGSISLCSHIAPYTTKGQHLESGQSDAPMQKAPVVQQYMLPILLLLFTLLSLLSSLVGQSAAEGAHEIPSGQQWGWDGGQEEESSLQLGEANLASSSRSGRI